MRTARGLGFALIAVFLLASPALAAGAGRYALVIGNSAYKDKPLKNPANDARDMAKALQRLGFDVQLKVDVPLRDMEEAIREFGTRLKRGGVGLFYFAGHGVQVQGVNYLVPLGANVASESDAKFECVDAGRVLGKMEDAGNELNIVILDACRNNPFARSFRSADQGLARMDAPTGSLVAYATAPNSVASDGKGANGMYTKYLLANLGTPGITIEEVFKRVRIGVMGETGKKQVPWESSSIAGYFYLADGPPQMAPQPQAQQQSAAEQRQQEQKLKEYIAGLEAEKKQVERERAELERRRQQLDQEAAKKLAEAQAPQERRLREQLAILEAERRKLEQERASLERARKDTERMQAEQQAKAEQLAKAQASRPQAGGVGQQASVQPPPPPQQRPPRPPRQPAEDRSAVLERLAGVWRLETDGNWRFPLLALKPGGDTLYGSLLGDERALSRVSLTGLAMEGGSLHVRLRIQPRSDNLDPRKRLQEFFRGQAPARIIECVGDVRGSQGGEIPMDCERVDAGAAQRAARHKETGRMVRTAEADPAW